MERVEIEKKISFAMCSKKETFWKKDLWKTEVKIHERYWRCSLQLKLQVIQYSFSKH